MNNAEEFYIQWCLEQQPEYEDMIREHAKGDGMQEIFSIMEQYKDHILDELEDRVEDMYGDAMAPVDSDEGIRNNTLMDVLELIGDIQDEEIQ